ncbi:nuclear transport factor 2 family protein [Undibacterium sp. TJN25]|uniref:nuclear transport factor 2 family protein n=1 Tax=Undibacterium sp. TJN25 TaxID=3413056 RepID=UPI003BF0AE43
MNTARELITEFLDCLQNLDTSLDRCVNLFAEEGTFELPYFPTLGLNWQFKGHDSIRAVLGLISKSFSSFTISNIDIHELENGKGLFIEYRSECFVRETGKKYTQDYVSRLDVEKGRSRSFANI